MLKEALDRLNEMAVAAATPKIISVPQEPSHVYGVFEKGELRVNEALPPTRQHNVLSLEAVMEWGSWLLPIEEEPLEPEPGHRVVVWYNRNAVIALNDLDRRNKATYKLTPSEPMILLQAMQAGNQRMYKQPEFVKLLRVKLAGCVDPSFLDRVRKVVFRTAGQSEGVAQHGKVSMGRKIEAELQGAELVPEMVTLQVPPFENLDLPRENITCAVDIDPHGEQFTLTPLPGEVERAWRGAEESIHGRLLELIVDGWAGSLCYGEP